MTTVSRIPRDTQAIPSTNGATADLGALAALIQQALSEHPELASLVKVPARAPGGGQPKLRCTRCQGTFVPEKVYSITVRHRENGKRVSDGGCYCCQICWPVLNKQLHLRSFGPGHARSEELRAAWELIREQRSRNGAH